jgi:Xaa-Pro dipeptidase
MLCKFKNELINHAKFVQIRQKPSNEFFKNNRIKFSKTFKSMSQIQNAFLFLKGPKEDQIYDDDMNYPVVPENFFYYLTGCSEPNTFALYNVYDEKMYLFVKLVDPKISFWEKHKSIEEMKAEYHLDDVYKVEEMEEIFNQVVPKSATVLVYKGVNPYSGHTTLNVLEEYQVKNFFVYNL